MNIDERCYGYEPAQSQLRELRAECERLREALKEIASHSASDYEDGWAVDIAQAVIDAARKP